MTDKEKSEFMEPILIALKDVLPQELKPKTNYTPASIDLNYERKMIEIGFKPIDLSTIKQDERQKFNQLSVKIPEHIALYLAKCEFPLKQEEIDMLEVEMEKHYGVQEPGYISMTSQLSQTGKSYEFLPEAGQFISGFLYIHEL